MEEVKSSFQKNKLEIFLVLSLIFTVCSPYIFTRNVFESLDFRNTGQIGDTIGGITGPIINMIGSYLVYLALKAQLEANQETATQAHFDRLVQALNSYEEICIGDTTDKLKSNASKINSVIDENTKMLYRSISGSKSLAKVDYQLDYSMEALSYILLRLGYTSTSLEQLFLFKKKVNDSFILMQSLTLELRLINIINHYEMSHYILVTEMLREFPKGNNEKKDFIIRLIQQSFLKVQKYMEPDS